MKSAHFNVALDGPSGAGKSSVADTIAEKYHLVHLDTGAMYRAVALLLDQQGIAAQESPALNAALDAIHLEMTDGRVVANGVDLSDKIRTPRVSLLASKYSAIPSVRRHLVRMQQAIAQSGGYIVDGRDICQVVLPDAQVKIYLDASAPARALRRQKQLALKGIDQPFQQILDEIEARDRQDRNRKTDPLRIAADAVVIDSSDIDFDATVVRVQEVIDATLKELRP